MTAAITNPGVYVAIAFFLAFGLVQVGAILYVLWVNWRFNHRPTDEGPCCEDHADWYE